MLAFATIELEPRNILKISSDQGNTGNTGVQWLAPREIV